MEVQQEIFSSSEDEDFLELVHLITNRVRRPQIFRERPNFFTKWDEKEFKDRFRLPKQAVLLLLEEIQDEIASKTKKNHALSPSDMLFITLRYLATGTFGQIIGDTSGVDKSTVSRAINKVTKAIAKRRNQFIIMPSTNEELDSVRQGFYNIAKFPRCIGAVDCTHAKIKSPGGQNAEIYRNRKGFFSFNIQCVCDANLKINDIVCRWPGSAHDSNIFKNSRLRHMFESGAFNGNLLVGDSGYGVKDYLITPLANPQTAEDNLFNKAQISTRNPIERTFGVLKEDFLS